MKNAHVSGSTLAGTPNLARHPLSAAVALVLGGLMPLAPAFAQTAGAAAPAAPAASAAKPDDSTIETVVVTARKVSERLQEVPLSITAISAKTIQDGGLRNLQDVANLTAGLTIAAAGAEAYLAPTIRGLTNLNGGSGDPNVAVFLDGIYLANNSAISLGLVAVERVEVVKGPVSALYGRNAFAGAINYVSKKPPKVFDGEVEIGGGSAGAATAKATMGGPLSSNASWLLSLGTDQSAGTWKDPVSGERAGGYDKKDGMLSLRFAPVAGLLIDGAVYYGDDQFDNVALGVAPNNCGTKTAANAPVNANAFKQFCGRFEYGPVQIPSFKPGTGIAGNSREVLFEKLRASYDFGPLEASVLYGHNDVVQQRLNDFSGVRGGIPYSLSNAATPAVPNGRTVLSSNNFGNFLANEDDQLEIRLQSRQDQPLRWSLGYNYFKSKFDSRTILGIDISNVPAGMVLTNVVGLPIHQLWGTVDGAVAPQGMGRTLGAEKTKSPFVGVDWDILPALTATAELRRTEQAKTQTILSTTSNQAPVNTAGNGTNTGDKDFSFTNYRASLRYKLANDNIVYVSTANGTKAGGFNGRATIAEDLSFDPETNRTLEAGTKLSFMDRKLQLGLSVFRVETRNIQISGPAADPKNPGLVTKNFGGTRSTGFELDIAAVPVRGLKLNAGIGYADSKFKSDAFDFTIPVADCQLIPTCNARLVTLSSPSGNKTALRLDGLRVPRSSKVTGVLGAQYNGHLSDQWDWMARLDYRYESSRMIQNANLAYIPNRSLVNLHFGIENEKYRLTAYINNVTNDATPEGVAQNVRTNDFTGPYAGGLPARRNFGIVGTMTF